MDTFGIRNDVAESSLSRSVKQDNISFRHAGFATKPLILEQQKNQVQNNHPNQNESKEISLELLNEKNMKVMRFQDGSKFIGKVIRQGYGTFKDADGSIYMGEWVQDMKHGEGRMIYASGD